jgi:hypothetical protein
MAEAQQKNQPSFTLQTYQNGVSTFLVSMGQGKEKLSYEMDYHEMGALISALCKLRDLATRARSEMGPPDD